MSRSLNIRGSGMTSARTRARLVETLKKQGIRHPAVLEAIGSVPRHLFVDEAMSHRAYENTALPIGLGQTLSQPYVVAKMTECVLAEHSVPLDCVLEVGTGSGYQAAVLSQVVQQVFTIERIGALLKRAKGLFSQLRLHNVHSMHGDGYAGWPGKAPFDGILVTAAPEHVPQALLEQLKDGGVLVVPEGGSDNQELKVYRRDGDDFSSEVVDLVRFVPLLHGVS